MPLSSRRPALRRGLLAGLLVVLAGCERGADAPATTTADGSPAGVPAEARPAQQIFDYRLIESQAGVKQWILQSEEMQKFTGQRDMILIDVHMDFFREGAHFSVLTADSGRANVYTKYVHTWGNVVVVTDDGRRLETSELFFNNDTGRIQNEVFNRFTRAHDVMTGIGLEATPDLDYIELKQDVQAAVNDSTDLAQPAARTAAPEPSPPEGEQQ